MERGRDDGSVGDVGASCQTAICHRSCSNVLIYARGKRTCKPLISATLEFASNSSPLRFLEPPAPGHQEYNDIHDASFVRHTRDGLQAHG